MDTLREIILICGEESPVFSRLHDFWCISELDHLIDAKTVIDGIAAGNNGLTAVVWGNRFLEIEGGILAEFCRNYGPICPPFISRDSQLAFYEFYVSFALTARQLNPVQRNNLGKRFRGIVRNKKQDLRSMAWEFSVASMFRTAGAVVTPNDLLECSPSFDYLVERQGVRVEVECKLVSLEKGEAFEFEQAARISDLAASSLAHKDIAPEHLRLIRIFLEDRTSNKTDVMKQLQRSLRGWEPFQVIKLPGMSIEISEHPYKLNPAGTDEERDKEIAKATNIDVGRYASSMNWISNGHTAQPTVTWIGSAKQTRVAENIARALKEDAKRQFSGKSAALLTVAFGGISWAQMLSILNAKISNSRHPLFFDDVCGRVFASSGTSHLMGIMCFPGRIHEHAHAALSRLSLDYIEGYLCGYFVPNPSFEGAERFENLGFATIPISAAAPAWEATSRFFIADRERLGISVPTRGGGSRWR